MHRNTITAVAAGIALSVALATGCSGDEPDGADAGAAGTGQQAEGGSSGSGKPAAEQVDELGGSRVAFGEPVEYADGLRIVVGDPQPLEVPSGAAGGAEEHVRLTVRLVNGSKRKVSPVDVALMVESGGGQAADVFDRGQKLNGPPRRAVAPGGEARWAQGFGVADPEDVVVVVQAGLDRIPVAFGAS
ncbi:hypothetical protein [Nocardioides solisilvae]|uniref:hypothetical protein n=1 Tax=Nocardioides solisilvae TaxID=1542435 RepID=UPI000D743B00|nr:hypothetical protein [Nocardioides solisilvae]